MHLKGEAGLDRPTSRPTGLESTAMQRPKDAKEHVICREVAGKLLFWFLFM